MEGISYAQLCLPGCVFDFQVKKSDSLIWGFIDNHFLGEKKDNSNIKGGNKISFF